MTHDSGRRRLPFGVPGWTLLSVLGLLLPSLALGAAPGFSIEAISLPDHQGAPATFLLLTVPQPPPVFKYYVKVEIRESGGGEVLFKDQVLASEDGEPEEVKELLQHRFVFRLPPGDLRAKVTMEDLKQDEGEEARLEFRVPDYSESELLVSDPVIGPCPEQEEVSLRDPDSGFPWELLRVLPERRFGDAQPRLCLWAQIRDRMEAREDSLYTVRYWIKNPRGRTLRKETVTVPRIQNRGAVRLDPDISDLTHQRYTVSLEILLGEKKVRRETWFLVDESRLSFIEDGDKLRQVLGYVATNQERIELELAPQDSLAAFWERFWSLRDPITGTTANEAMIEFIRRVDHTANHFGTLEPGWATDRGRIYIQFGPPDHSELVDRDPSGLPTLLWYYYDRHLTFVFQDPQGLGSYRLTGRRRRS